MRCQSRFPLATLVINVSGCFAISLLATVLTSVHDGGRLAALQAVFATGFLGGYTTFSAYALDTVLALRDKDLAFAALNWCGSVVLGLSAAALGGAFARTLGL